MHIFILKMTLENQWFWKKRFAYVSENVSFIKLVFENIDCRDISLSFCVFLGIGSVRSVPDSCFCGLCAIQDDLWAVQCSFPHACFCCWGCWHGNSCCFYCNWKYPFSDTVDNQVSSHCQYVYPGTCSWYCESVEPVKRCKMVVCGFTLNWILPSAHSLVIT